MTTSAPPTPPKLGIAINLDDLRKLMREFINEVIAVDEDDDKDYAEWTLETFLQWLRKRQEALRREIAASKGHVLSDRLTKENDKAFWEDFWRRNER